MSRMAGTVYLRTNRFEVKLEGITFKTKDFEELCTMDFLFPDGRVWARPPIVGLDVMRHPRDPNILLVLLCFGVGCVILRFFAGQSLPASVQRFLTDKRIHFVGFGIPEKKDLFPFEELGLSKRRMDIGYLAARILKDPKCKRWELAELARKVIGIKRMIGLTEASSFERHEQIKCAICQLFVTSVIAMGLLGSKDRDFDTSPKKNALLKNLSSIHLLAEGWFKMDKKNLDESSNKSSFLKNLNFNIKNSNSFHSLTEGWFKLPTGKKRNQKETQVEEEEEYVNAQAGEIEYIFRDNTFVKTKEKENPFGSCFNVGMFHESPFGSCFMMGSRVREGSVEEDFYNGDIEDDSSGSEFVHEEYSRVKPPRIQDDDEDDSQFNYNKDVRNLNKKPLKGILKCPSTNLLRTYSFPHIAESPPTSNEQTPTRREALKRANSKGCNVSFIFT